MHNRNIKKSKHILTIALASLIVLTATSAAVMSGCGESSESTNETKTVTETELVTVVVDGTYATDANGNTVSAENTGSQTSSNGNSGEKNENSSSQNTNNSGSSSANSSSGGNSSNNSASSNSSNSNNNKGNNNNNGNSSSSANSNGSSSSSSDSSTSSNTHKPVTDSNACSLDGHKFAVGDTVTCVYKLYAPEALQNYQAYISYDTKYLSVKSAKLDGPAKSGGLLNYKLDGKIKFNGSNISSGYDYTDTDSFVIVNYEIKTAGSTTPKFTWEVATGESQKAYVENNKPVNGLKITKEYS